MIVPDYWAEARVQSRSKGKQITVRRFGWSVTSEADAQKLAQSRAEEALNRILSGEKLGRHEQKSAYNGAVGVPIREEVLARFGEEVITRNSYGAHCLNSPRALFADIDVTSSPPGLLNFSLWLVLTLASLVTGFVIQSRGTAIALCIVSLLLFMPLARVVHSTLQGLQGGKEQMIRRRIRRFLLKKPAWNLRLYATPAGYRLLATHKPFETSDPEVARFFSALHADPIYVRMCQNQNCFRARLTAKPWRMGIKTSMRPRPGVWPVNPDKRPIRDEWIREYEKRSVSFAACRFLEAFGSGNVDASLKEVIELHDRESKAGIPDLPLA